MDTKYKWLLGLYVNTATQLCSSWLETTWDQGLRFVQWTIWKHLGALVDTSNALEQLAIDPPQQPTRPFINELPNEIMIRIFSFVVHSDSKEHKDHYTYHICRRISSGSSPTTPLTLTHVCHVWRYIVQYTPTLWSTIMVMSPSQSDVDYVSFLLGKTGKCLLSIGLEQYYDPDPASLAIFKLFAAEAHRWRRVRFTLKMRNIQEVLSILSTHQLTNLEEYRVRAETWDRAHVDEFFNLLHSSTVLSNIDWGGSLPGPLREGITWSQISELSLRFTDLSQSHLDALAACRSLKVLRLRRAPVHIAIENLTPIPRLTSIVLPSVERLVIGGPNDNSGLFDAFTLPMLSHLELNDRKWNHYLPGHGLISLTNMVTRSNCVIRTLYLDACNISIISSPIFDGVETLNVLSRVGEQELKLFIPFDDLRQARLPNLKRLTLHNFEADDCVMSDVVWPRREKLELLELCMDVEKFPRDYKTLSWLEKRGLSLTISRCVPDFPSYIFRANHPRNVETLPLLYLPHYWEDLW